MLRTESYRLEMKNENGTLSAITKYFFIYLENDCVIYSVWNIYKFETRNIFPMGNEFSRRSRRCRFRICNNIILSKMKEGGRLVNLLRNIRNMVFFAILFSYVWILFYLFFQGAFYTEKELNFLCTPPAVWEWRNGGYFDQKGRQPPSPYP